MSVPLNVLILEDQPEDTELLLYELKQAGFAPNWQRVETERDYIAGLREDLDIILADFSMPELRVTSALDLLQARGLDIPFIVVTGSVTEQVLVETLQRGAVDYLIKDRLTRLGQAVTHALQEKRLRDAKREADQALRESEARFRRLAENAPDVIYRYRLYPSTSLEYVNPAITTTT